MKECSELGKTQTNNVGGHVWRMHCLIKGITKMSKHWLGILT